MRYLIGIDIGTSGTKTVVVDETGRVKARAVAEYPLYTPKPQWSEQEPEDWWQATCRTVREVLEKAGIDAGDVAGIGLSGQMHGSVFLDENHQVIRPALLWNDQRTQNECDWITDTVGRDRIVALLSNPVLTGFTAPKILWLRNHEPERYARVRRVLLPKDFVRYRLTGEFATEVSDASGTALFNVKERTWAWEVLDAIGIPRDWMPAVYESPEVSGRITEAAATATGLRPGTPVVGGGGDQAAGAVGNGIVQTGVVSSTVGTSGVVFAFSDTPVVDPQLRLHTFCHAVPGKWHLMGVMLSAGGSLQWYRDTFCQAEQTVAATVGRDPYELICAGAATAPAGSEGLIFLPYLTGERTPYPDPNARGVLFGLTRRTNRAHVARAILEGVAYGLNDSFLIMQGLGVPIREVRASGGGARSALWRQILADVTGHAHVTINVDEGPAFGVALLAGVGTGVYPSVEAACAATIQPVDRTEPCTVNHAAYRRLHAVYQALYAHLKEDFATVTQLING
ncbi:MAG: xylulokinase [Chloroherpetonaceae bacterium]|nr:xylulokinase [Chthonomonadaceae bacterium]MDW8208531.1 xylulokinase [Chloroherpetonaceae bacterium]